MKTSFYTVLRSPRLLAILLTGFASGLPLALTSSTLQAWFTQANINVVTIGALSLLGIPYILKFLWAPLMDHYGFAKLGKRKGWLLVSQALIAVFLFILANMEPTSMARLMGLAALCVAFFSASQDISVIAYQTDVANPEERGLGASYIVLGNRIAGLVSGGLALVIAQHFGWKVTYEVMGFIMLLMMIGTYFSPDVPDQPSPPHLYMTIKESVQDLFRRPHILFLLFFIFSYKFGDALALSLMTNFLLHTLGFSLTEIGIAFKIVGVAGILLGAFAGGLILVRWNIFQALLCFGLSQAFSNLLFVVLAIYGKHFGLMIGTMFVENFCSGLSTAALLAFMMSLCNHRYTATQFALLSAIASLGRVFLGPVAGVMVEHLGWVQFYIWAFVLCLPSILILILLKEKVLSYAVVTAE
jgi:PAT family beta-lactamase induction signal transducer AmpG